MHRLADFLTRSRATLYVFVTLLGAIGAYAFNVRMDGIFACPGTGYGHDDYLAYCQANHYGDYDHGAFWFDLEQPSGRHAAAAQVLFLGNSRLEFAFAPSTTAAWFRKMDASYYLLGFAYWENFLFEGPLLRKIKPQPAVYIISMESFFENTETPPAKLIMHDEDAESHYRLKRLWQFPHRFLCSHLSELCGNEQAFYRSRSTGGYALQGGPVGSYTSTYNETVDHPLADAYTERARGFFDSLNVPRECIILTIVPSIDTQVGTARSIATSLGVAFIAPKVDGLTTFDKSHMNVASAQRWSQAFLEAAAPKMQACLTERNTHTSLSQ